MHNLFMLGIYDPIITNARNLTEWFVIIISIAEGLTLLKGEHEFIAILTTAHIFFFYWVKNNQILLSSSFLYVVHGVVVGCIG